MEGSAASVSPSSDTNHAPRPPSGITRAAYAPSPNDTAKPSREDDCIHARFESLVAQQPDSVALISDDEHLTYFQLNRRANKAAHALLVHGIRPEERVGIYAARGIEMVIGMLAALKAGGAYVPLDPDYPRARLAFISDDSSCVAVLTTTTLRDQLPIKSPKVLVLDGEITLPDENPCTRALRSQNAAYVIYTSGSTGLPKGVIVEHHSVLGLVVGSSYARLQGDDCVAHCASPSFDAATWEVWGPLLNGAQAVIVPQRAVLSPVAFDQLLNRRAVTAMFLTVGLFNEYVDKLELGFGGMRHLLVGGDKLTPAIMNRAARKAVRPRHLLNAYGPTETTTFAVTFEVTGEAHATEPLPIGRPISNIHVHILDSALSPVPIGKSGEIFIGGHGVARGYLSRPELTAERFVADPFSDSSAARLYRTGDIGRWRADGNIEFLGRQDSQMKIRGFRVEPGEIEAALQRHPCVKQATVITREDKDGLKHLIAYVTADPSSTTGDLEADARAYLAQSLPNYMVPATVMVLENFPLTSNGKVDRQALPAPVIRNTPPIDHSAQTPTERVLAEIWGKVLKLDHIGLNDNFFELGGDSIMGLDLIAKISDELKLEELSVIDLFENPSPRGMASLIVTLTGPR